MTEREKIAHILDRASANGCRDRDCGECIYREHCFYLKCADELINANIRNWDAKFDKDLEQARREIVDGTKLFFPCRYEPWEPDGDMGDLIDPQGIWEDGKWYEWIDKHGNIEVARMKENVWHYFYPDTKIIKEKDVIGFRIPPKIEE